MKILSWLGHRVRELGIYYQYLIKACRRPVMFVSVSDSVSGFSSELRGKNPVELWRSQGINAILLPPQLEISQRRRLATLLKPEVVIHQTFRLEGNDPSLYPKAVNILDLDDADFLDPRIQPRMEASLKLCDGGVGGSRYTEAWIKTIVDASAVIWTGSKQKNKSISISASTDNIVWAITSPLDNPIEAEFIKAILAECSQQYDFNFTVIGRGESEEIKAFFDPALRDKHKIIHHPFLPYDEFLTVLSSATAGLAPLFEQENDFNKGKSFGKILAYLTAGIPVITTYAADHELFFEDGVNGFISNDPQHWLASIGKLLTDAQLRQQIIENAARDYNNKLSLEVYANQTMRFIRERYQAKIGRSLNV